MDAYARVDRDYQKDLEESQIRHDVYTNIIENCQWSTAEMEVLGHSYIFKLQRVRSSMQCTVQFQQHPLMQLREDVMQVWEDVRVVSVDQEFRRSSQES